MVLRIGGTALFLPVLLLQISTLCAAPVSFSDAGADPTAIQGVFDDFVAALGGPNNGTAPGSQGIGFRRITWDGGGAAAPASFFGIPMVAFANRGNVYTTPGTGFEISGQPSPEFGDQNPTYPDSFQPFSGARLFAALGSNIMDVLITTPGSETERAVTRGFGVVFSDVDLANTTSLEFFDFANNSLGTYYAGTADNGLSFLGVTFDTPVVARVRITSGNSAFGPNDGGGIDVVATDDFVFAEPVPEPATTALVGLGIGIVGLWRKLRRSR